MPHWRESSLRTHAVTGDSRVLPGLAWKEELLKYSVITISGIVKRAIKHSQGFLGREINSGDFGIWGTLVKGPSECELRELWAVSSCGKCVSSTRESTECPELKITFSAQQNISRFFLLLKAILKSLCHIFPYDFPSMRTHPGGIWDRLSILKHYLKQMCMAHQFLVTTVPSPSQLLRTCALDKFQNTAQRERSRSKAHTKNIRLISYWTHLEEVLLSCKGALLLFTII